MSDGRVLVVGPGGDAPSALASWQAITPVAITPGELGTASGVRAVLRPRSAIVIRYPPHRHRIARLLLRNVPGDRPAVVLGADTWTGPSPTLTIAPRHETRILSALARLGALHAVLDLHTGGVRDTDGRPDPALRREDVPVIEGALQSVNWLLDLERDDRRRRARHVTRIIRAFGRSVLDPRDPW